MGIEVTGKIHVIGDTQQVSERFSKRQFVLEIVDNPKYPQLVALEFTGDKCSELDGYNVGETVHVDFNLRGREWRSPSGEVKYFNTLQAWRIERPGQARTQQRSARGTVRDEPPQPQWGGSNVDDDIPF